MKYKNKRICIKGIWFHSQKEGFRYLELLQLEKQGKITDLKRQVKYELIPKQEGERPCAYIADFTYQEGGQTVVEDTKGYKTKDYVIKRKLMLWRHGIKTVSYTHLDVYKRQI